MGIGHCCTLPHVVDWQAIKALADKQGLAAIVVDGLNEVKKIHANVNPNYNIPQVSLLQWIGEVMQNYEQRYVQYEKAIASLAGWYNQHGYKMMLLKGFACSIDWPKPEHRPCGDIDIWLFGKQKEADALLAKEKGVKVDSSHHHHTVFDWCGFTVENHYDFVNVHANKSSAELEKVLKELGADGSHSVEVKGEKVFLPSPNLHTLFLIRHMVSHFASAEITLRQVLDWAFFVEMHTKYVDWAWLLTVLEKYHMKDFFNIINAICVEDLGFDASIFPLVQFDPFLKDRVLQDILEPAYGALEPKGFFARIIYKYQRWQGNEWKQELCYDEGRWSAFWRGVWNHLLKPASI